jgi:hypothetical protein
VCRPSRNARIRPSLGSVFDRSIDGGACAIALRHLRNVPSMATFQLVACYWVTFSGSAEVSWDSDFVLIFFRTADCAFHKAPRIVAGLRLHREAPIVGWAFLAPAKIEES